MTDQHDGQTGTQAGGGHLLNLRSNLRPDFSGDLVAIENGRCHEPSPPLNTSNFIVTYHEKTLLASSSWLF